MAYKFQVGAATLSGSTKFEEVLDAAGGIKLSGVSAETASLGADSILFRDSDGTMKHESFSDYATLIAGDGLSAENGVLEVEVSELVAVTAIASGDTFAIAQEAETGDPTRKITFDKMAEKLAGSGIAHSAGVLAVGVDDSGIEINSDALRLKDNGVTLAKMAGLAAAKFILGDSNGDPAAVTMSGDATMDNAGAITIAANAVEDSMVNDNVATGLAGDGLSAASGVMAVDLNELTAADLASGDFLAFVDSDGSNATKKESVDDLATLFAGSGLAASSAVLSVQVSGALKVASDKVGISGSFAGIGLSFDGGADSISGIDLDLNELTAGAIANGDFLAFVDANDSNVTKKEAVADLATLFAGDGLVAASSVLAVNPGKGLEINSDAVRVKVASNGGITRGAGSGSDEVAMNMNGLDAADVAVGADSIAIVDADDSNKTKKESIADLVTAMAGVGLSASSGVLRAGLDVALKADGNTLAVGMNYMADMSSDGEDTLTLPASADLVVGDIIHVKAPSDCSSARTVKIARAGSQTIDGLTQVIIESPFGAVSMVYVAADNLRLI